MRHQSAELDPTPFGGRYTLLRRLAVGGMAEIYLARQAAMAGFEKDVVIKRLRGELAHDPRIVEMFLDEARIGALLNHPNIVHVYDVDEHDGVPYIAMEFIVGEELNELCRRGLAHGRFLPLEHAVELIRQGAAGMGYFHAKRSAESATVSEHQLDIVHCDISPTNLLVTQDGFLKIIDFGIARAQGQRHRGENAIPGKLSYMSPEQASRKPIDHRSDIYSLGIVLYEITVGKRLFRGPAQQVVQRLVDGKIEPPTFARRNFPPALESIVMRALEKHPDDRYQSAYDLADDLESFLREHRLNSGPVRIARYLDVLATADGGTRRPELISEAESKHDGDDLDFDSQTFGAFAPPEGAKSPAQAPEWEDPEQPDADIAAALGMELTELRAMRTPVPGREPYPRISHIQIAPPPQHIAHGGHFGEDEFDSLTNPLALNTDGSIGLAKSKIRAVGTVDDTGPSARMPLVDDPETTSLMSREEPPPLAEIPHDGHHDVTQIGHAPEGAISDHAEPAVLASDAASVPAEILAEGDADADAMVPIDADESGAIVIDPAPAVSSGSVEQVAPESASGAVRSERSARNRRRGGGDNLPPRRRRVAGVAPTPRRFPAMTPEMIAAAQAAATDKAGPIVAAVDRSSEKSGGKRAVAFGAGLGGRFADKSGGIPSGVPLGDLITSGSGTVMPDRRGPLGRRRGAFGDLDPVPVPPVAPGGPSAFGSAMLQRSEAARLPWILVVLLVLALVGTLGYILFK